MGLAASSNMSRVAPTQQQPNAGLSQVLQALMQMRQQGGFPGKGPSRAQQPQPTQNPAFGRQLLPMPGAAQPAAPQSIFQMPTPFVPTPVQQPPRQVYTPPAPPPVQTPVVPGGYWKGMTLEEFQQANRGSDTTHGAGA